jgi:glutathione S-transferase
MEFGSAILSDVWGLETAREEATYLAKREALATKFTRMDAALADGPFFSGERFSLVDAVFAPIFRYFDVFDAIADTSAFDGLEKVQAWRRVLAGRDSVVNAVTSDYAQRLHAFLREHDAYLLQADHSLAGLPPRRLPDTNVDLQVRI